MTLILIIISLILGFLQGYRLRRKKLILEIVELKKENDTLTTEIDNIKIKHHLSQYNVKQNRKFNSLVFQQDLIKTISNYNFDNQLYFLGSLELIKAIAKGNNNLDLNNSLLWFNFLEYGNSYMKSIQQISNAENLLIKIKKNERIYSLSPIETWKKLKNLFNVSIDIEKYDLTIQDLISSIELVGEIIDY